MNSEALTASTCTQKVEATTGVVKVDLGGVPRYTLI